MLLCKVTVRTYVSREYSDAGVQKHIIWARKSDKSLKSAVGEGVTRIDVVDVVMVEKNISEFTGMEFMTESLRNMHEANR